MQVVLIVVPVVIVAGPWLVEHWQLAALVVAVVYFGPFGSVLSGFFQPKRTHATEPFWGRDQVLIIRRVSQSHAWLESRLLTITADTSLQLALSIQCAIRDDHHAQLPALICHVLCGSVPCGYFQDQRLLRTVIDVEVMPRETSTSSSLGQTSPVEPISRAQRGSRAPLSTWESQNFARRQHPVAERCQRS